MIILACFESSTILSKATCAILQSAFRNFPFSTYYFISMSYNCFASFANCITSLIKIILAAIFILLLNSNSSFFNFNNLIFHYFHLIHSFLSTNYLSIPSTLHFTFKLIFYDDFMMILMVIFYDCSSV